jgi:hypothetical protein
MKPIVVAFLVASILAAAAGTAGSLMRETFAESIGLQGMGAAPPDPSKDPIALTRLSERKNSALVGGLMGAALCALGGAAAAVSARRSGSQTAVGLLGGLGIGAVAGGAAGYLAAQTFHLPNFAGSTAPLRTAAAHLMFWLWLAAGYLLSVRLGSGRAIAGRLLPGVLAAAIVSVGLHPLLSTLAFPLSNSDLPIPLGVGNVALWLAIPFMLFGLAAARAIAKPDSIAAVPAEAIPAA